jgi:DNA-binding transcriptional regulator LsrR (DeoR family)
MPAARINMRKIKDVLRLKLHAGLSHERIAASLDISKGVVAKYASLAAAAGLDWPTVERLSEAALERHLVGGRAVMDQIQWWGCSRGRSPTP